jgi:hypothetical protein
MRSLNLVGVVNKKLPFLRESSYAFGFLDDNRIPFSFICHEGAYGNSYQEVLKCGLF